jgi:hypothetical protein
MKNRMPWVKLPSKWITSENSGLKNFTATDAAKNTAALMCLTVICHEADQETGIANVTFDTFEKVLSKSRTTIAAALNVLRDQNLVADGVNRSTYKLVSFDPKSDWAKLPHKSLYLKNDFMPFFSDCTLRKRTELDALKLFFLIAAFRDNSSNITMISYDKIETRTGITREHIRRAISLLINNGLANTELRANKQAYGVVQGYRLTGIASYIHAGTQGRRELAEIQL